MSDSPFLSADISPERPELNGLRFATVTSRALGRRGEVSLYAAPGAERDAPLVVLLHGVTGSHWNWAIHGNAHVILRDLVALGRVRPMVLAMPSDGLRGIGSAYLRHDGEDAEAWIRDEVPYLASQVYPGAGAAGVCIGGLSMGGYGAMRMGGRYPERYKAIAATSSVTHLRQLRAFGEFESSDGDEGVIDPLLRAGERLPPLWIDCGLEDGLIDPNRRLHEKLVAAGIRHTYNEFPGGHDWDYWPKRLRDILAFFDEALG